MWDTIGKSNKITDRSAELRATYCFSPLVTMMAHPPPRRKYRARARITAAAAIALEKLQELDPRTWSEWLNDDGLESVRVLNEPTASLVADTIAWVISIGVVVSALDASP